MIVVDRVSKYYGSSAAVSDLDFTIEEGECVGFLGLNGAGKSTTLRMLSCLLLPTSGRISIRGFDVEDEPHEIRKLIGYLPDNPPLYPEMRVIEFLRFAGRLRRMSKAEVEKRLPEVIEVTGLEEVADQPISTLSHGYRQRVGIAQAIVHRPALLILDEPIQGLDPVQIVEMRELIRSLRGEHTILLSSHILSEIERTCDRILMLHKGRIVAKGTEEELVGRTQGAAAYRDAAGQSWLQLEVRGDEAAVRGALDVEGLTLVEVLPAGEERVVVKLQAAGD
ncbi:MAG: ABC transporter ATP-binding protein, partial [Gemmatimonadota bacterium]|nr:ABC transporter ATP-binding protein [Gemmatimonadota bacterium]